MKNSDYPNPSQDDRIAASARRFVDRAFTCHEQSDWEGFVVHASTAIELLAKAVLAQVNLLLIAEERNEERLLDLARSDPRRGIPASVRTINADAALRRARKIGVPFDRYANDIDALRKARNTIMHTGSYDAATFDSAWFDAWVRSMVALSEYGKYSANLTFGRNAPLVELAMERYGSQLEGLWVQRQAAAQHRWKTAKAELDAIALTIRREMLQAEYSRAKSDDPRFHCLPCPVCGLPAIMMGEFDIDPDWDYSDDDPFWPDLDFEFVPTNLKCPTCGLRLDSWGLIEKSGILKGWEFSEDDRAIWEEYLWEQGY